jgi:hypothetical protein
MYGTGRRSDGSGARTTGHTRRAVDARLDFCDGPVPGSYRSRRGPWAAQGERDAAVIRRPAQGQRRRPTGRRKGVGLRGEGAQAQPSSTVPGGKRAGGGGSRRGWHHKDKVESPTLMQGRRLEIAEVRVAAPGGAVLPRLRVALRVPRGPVAVRQPWSVKVR